MEAAKAKESYIKIWIGCIAFCTVMGVLYGGVVSQLPSDDTLDVLIAHTVFCPSIVWLITSLCLRWRVWPAPVLLLLWSFTTQMCQL